MGKKSKKKGIGTVGLLLTGAVLAFVAYQVASKFVENYENGIGVSIKKVRFKFTGSLISFSLFGKQINIPQYATWFIEAQIRNDNAIGGNIQGFDGWINYGLPPNGIQVAPLKAGNFQLPARGTVTPVFQIDQDLLSVPLVVKNIVAKIKAGEYKKVFIAGKLRTSLGAVNVAQEVSLLSA